jgi:hypothetical protein
MDMSFKHWFLDRVRNVWDRSFVAPFLFARDTAGVSVALAAVILFSVTITCIESNVWDTESLAAVGVCAGGAAAVIMYRLVMTSRPPQ